MPALQPSRVSSEAPEVVPGQFLTTATDSTNIPPPSPSASPSRPSSYLASQHSRAHSWLSTISDRKSKQPDGTRIPQIIHDDAEPYQPKVHSRRVFSLMTTVILVLVAFFLGGGVGGGVASAAMSAQKSRSPTSTSTASDSQSTVIVDMAGCPLVNNSTYISQTGAEFLTICSTSILAEPSGQNVDLSNSIQSSFDSCLNACAAANGCVGATWYMFHPTTPSYNSRCFLKNGTGQEVVASGGLSVVSGYLKSALPP